MNIDNALNRLEEMRKEMGCPINDIHAQILYIVQEVLLSMKEPELNAFDRQIEKALFPETLAISRDTATDWLLYAEVREGCRGDKPMIKALRKALKGKS
jgi:hypothetical protein